MDLDEAYVKDPAEFARRVARVRVRTAVEAVDYALAHTNSYAVADAVIMALLERLSSPPVSAPEATGLKLGC